MRASIIQKDYLDVPPTSSTAPWRERARAILRLAVGGEAVDRRRSAGAIVSTASSAGQRGSTVVEYGASGSRDQSDEGLGAQPGRHGIRVNAIAPGLINTATGARTPPVKGARKGSALGRRRAGRITAVVVSW
jgi:NAD(P)-dependent dehydrogenase (short-subunit alcohol dehydrogenase family)